MQLGKEFKNISLSHGTLRAEDLIQTFSEFLKKHDKKTYHEIFANKKDLQILKHIENGGDFYNNDDLTEIANWLLEDLFDALDSIAPDGCYFGIYPGDASDFGFWEFYE